AGTDIWQRAEYLCDCRRDVGVGRGIQIDEATAEVRARRCAEIMNLPPARRAMHSHPGGERLAGPGVGVYESLHRMQQWRGFIRHRDLSNLPDQKRGIGWAGKILVVRVGLL